MKIAAITRHWAANYGSFLQTLATQWAIESLGHECEIIDYVRSDEGRFRQELLHYDAISVREDSARERVRLFGMDAVQVFDPTFLWLAERWNKFAASPSGKDYVLIYQIHNDERVTDCAREAAYHHSKIGNCQKCSPSTVR